MRSEELCCCLVAGVKTRVGGLVHGSAAPLAGGTPSMLSSVGSSTKEGVLGSASSPIHMVSSEGGFKQQFWRTLRTLALGFLLISGLGALVEDKGLGKGVHLSHQDNIS